MEVFLLLFFGMELGWVFSVVVKFYGGYGVKDLSSDVKEKYVYVIVELYCRTLIVIIELNNN